MSKVKVCGLRRTEDVDVVNRFLPDFVGFIFVAGRTRAISYEQAAALRAKLDARIKPVGVFWDAPIDQIVKAKDIIEVVQLHGNEDNAYIRAVQRETGLPVIKAFDGGGDLSPIARTAADFVLLDSKGGGTGRTFDWTRAAHISQKLFIAGGLNPLNAADAIARLDPYAVDVSSGVETDGYKDARKVEAFMKAVKGAKYGA